MLISQHTIMVWCWESGEKPSNDIGGLTGAESAIVGGNVNIEVNGSHLKHTYWSRYWWYK